MALKTIGYVGVPKKDATKRYMRLNKGITLKVILENGTEVTLPPESYLNMFAPRKGDKQSDEQFEELSKWKRFDICVAIDD
jgi:hypothetical protein